MKNTLNDKLKDLENVKNRLISKYESYKETKEEEVKNFKQNYFSLENDINTIFSYNEDLKQSLKNANSYSVYIYRRIASEIIQEVIEIRNSYKKLKKYVI